MKSKGILTTFLVLAACCSLLWAGIAGAADDFPKRGITVVVGYGAGGGTDLIARVLAKNAEKHLGVTVTVVNKIGGASVPSMSELLKTKPDGYTLQLTTPVLVQYHHISNVVKWDYKSFTRIMNVGSDPYVIACNPSLPWKNIDDLVAAAKKEPNKYKGAIVAPGVIWGDSVISFVEDVGLFGKITIVPNPAGTAGCVKAVLGGHCDFLGVSAGEILDHVKAGKMRLLGVSGDKRNPNMPDVPTINEQGYNVYPVSNFRGLIAPPGVDPAIVKTLVDAFTKAVQEQEFVDFMNGRGMGILVKTGEDYDKFLEAEDGWFANFYKNSQYYQAMKKKK